MYKIIFCNDGVMRVRKDYDNYCYPFMSLQKFQNKDDSTFIINNLKKTVIFEDKLTVFTFLKCLEPWVKTFEKITNVNISEYISECRKPSTIDETLSYITIKYITEISPEVEFEDNELDDLSNPLEWINLKHKKRLSGKWSIDSYYNVTGHSLGNHEHYCIDHTPFNKLANLPVYLDMQQYLYIDSFHLKEFKLNNEIKLFGSIPLNGNTLVLGPKFHTLYDVINGFFHWIPSSTSTRDDFVNKLLTIKNNIEFEVDSHNKVNKEGENPKVIISEHAFDDLIENSSLENNYWDEFKIFDRQINKVFKIGEVVEAKCPEERFLNTIIEPNQKTNPTEFL